VSADRRLDSDRLTGLKEVAVFLQKDVRTIHRWIGKGLPVQRLRIGRKATIYASKSEIELWLARQGQSSESANGFRPAEQDAQSRGQSHPRAATDLGRGWKRRLWLGSGLVLLGIMSASPWKGERIPANWSVKGTRLEVYDRSGARVWHHEFQFALRPSEYGPTHQAAEPSVAIDDLDGDGDPEVLLITEPAAGTPPSREMSAAIRLHCFNKDGSPRFEFSFQRTLRFPNQRHHDPPFGASRFLLTSEADGTKTIWVVSLHHRDFSSVLQKVTPSGVVVGEYWSKGHILGLPREALIDGRRLLLVGGTDNEFYGASLAVLDYYSPSGTSPAASDEYRCLNCPNGRPLAYFVFPAMEMAHATGGRPYVTDLTVGSDRQISVRIQQGRPSLFDQSLPDVYYRLDARLELVGAEIGDGYRAMHADLERKGPMTHRYGSMDLSQMFPVLTWTRSGFSRIERAPVANSLR
jgi:hypothetical protein